MHETSAPRTQCVLRSDDWREYFRENARRQRPLPWEGGAAVTEAEIAAIAKSLQGWQLGETSDGSHLIRAAMAYARQVGDEEFLDAARLFIREEQRHGEMLGRFLDLAGAGRVGANWGDTLFRLARYSVPRMEAWATPVVMVETHAMVYYNALRRATRSPLLRGICRQILADEVPHIRFQCERLAILHQRRSPALRAVTMLFHRAMFAAITLAVWAGHRRALRAGGYPFRAFWRAAWGRMDRAWRLMDPARYEWSPEPAGVPA